MSTEWLHNDAHRKLHMHSMQDHRWVQEILSRQNVLQNNVQQRDANLRRMFNGKDEEEMQLCHLWTSISQELGTEETRKS